MNRNEIVDKAYLALELTKLSCSTCSNKEILENYNYFLKGLTGIENIGLYKDLEKDYDTLKNDYKLLKQNFNIEITNTFNLKHGKVLTYLEEVKGDMEPYVYNQLKDLLK